MRKVLKCMALIGIWLWLQLLQYFGQDEDLKAHQEKLQSEYNAIKVTRGRRVRGATALLF